MSLGLTQPERRAALGQARGRSILAAASLLASIGTWISMRGRSPQVSHWDIVALWMTAILTLLLAVGWSTWRPPRWNTFRERALDNRLDVLAACALVAMAAALRAWRVDQYPHMFSGDEGVFGVSARSVLDGSMRNPFAVGWLSHPTLFFFLQAASMAVLGESVSAVRLVSAMLGTASVLATFLYARRVFGLAAGIAAATLLATSGFHLFVSRLALNNVSDALFLPLTLWAVDRAVRGQHGTSPGGGRRAPTDAVLAGVVVGVSQYFYFGARLLPFLAAAVLLLAWAVSRMNRPIWRIAALMLLGFSVTVLPFAAYYVDHRADVLARQRDVSIFTSPWLDSEKARTAQSAAAIVVRKIVRVAILPFAGDVTVFYRPPAPFAGKLLVVPIALGMAVTFVRCRSVTYGALLIAWILVVLGAASTDGTLPLPNRLASMGPIYCLFAAIGIVQAMTFATERLRVPRRVAVAALAVATLGTALWSAREYFLASAHIRLYTDSNTEVASTLANEIRDIPNLTVYFSGVPRMRYDSFNSLAFIAPRAKGITVDDPWTPEDIPPPISGPTLFVFLPHRLNELTIVSKWFPSGRPREVQGDDGQPLYVEYAVGFAGSDRS